MQHPQLQKSEIVPVSLIDIQVAVTGRAKSTLPHWLSISSVTHDSKATVRNSLFVAIKGTRFDGHDFINEAKQNGAICALVERFVDVPIYQILVPSSIIAFGDVARLYMSRLSIPTVAVTGSVGKTSTKKLISETLSKKFLTQSSFGNFNNELGVPISAFSVSSNHGAAVFELAMRGANQIGYLSRIVRPSVAVITKIGISHIETLGSQAEIAKAKVEVIQGMDSQSTLVLNIDDPFFSYFKDAAPGRTVSFGVNDNADYRISNVQLNSQGHPSFRINAVPFEMQRSFGKHHAYNAGAAFAVAEVLGIRADDVQHAVNFFDPPGQRGDAKRARVGAVIFDNSYNASPDSVEASLGLLGDVSRRGRRTIAVLGEMLELGEHSKEAHELIGAMVKRETVDVLVTIGENAKYIGECAGITGWQHCKDVLDAAAILLKTVLEDDVVLIQGSRQMRLDEVVDALVKGSISVGPS